MDEPKTKEPIEVTLTVHSASGHDVFQESLDKVVDMIGDAIRTHGKWLYVGGRRVKYDPSSPESETELRSALTETPQARLTGSLRGGQDLHSLTLMELREMAKGGVVKGYSQMSKMDLAEALEEAGVSSGPKKAATKKTAAKKKQAAPKKSFAAKKTSSPNGEEPVFEGTFQSNSGGLGRKVSLFNEVKPRSLEGFRDCILVMNNSKNRKIHIEVDPRSSKTVLIEVMAALMEYGKQQGVIPS